MTTRAAYASRLDAELRKWDAEIAVWSAKADALATRARIDCDNELDSLRSKRAVADSTLRNLAACSDDAWEDLRDRTDRTWAWMGKAMEKAAVRFA